MLLSTAVVLLFLGLLSAGVESRKLTEDEKKLLANTSYDLLPPGLQAAIRRSKLQKRDIEEEEGDPEEERSGHWCCANEQPVNSIQRSRVKTEPVKVHEKVKIGYTDCGFLGATRCSLYDLRYRVEMRYYIDYYEVPNQAACPDMHVKCCKGFVLVAHENCLSLQEAGDHIDTLKGLLESGLIGDKPAA